MTYVLFPTAHVEVLFMYKVHAERGWGRRMFLPLCPLLVTPLGIGETLPKPDLPPMENVVEPEW